METLQSSIGLSKDEQKRVKELKLKLMKHPDVITFLNTYQINEDAIDKFLPQILEFTEEKNACKQCKGIHECSLKSEGFQSVLSYDRGDIDLLYTPCKYKRALQEEESASALIKTLYMPAKMVKNAGEIDITKERAQVLNHVSLLIRTYGTPKQAKGLYLHSPYGNGKTYILSYLANKFAKKGLKVLMAYYPDLAREIKSSISTGSLESKIEELKLVDVLILDDIGGEQASAWVRDEVLGPILQYRTMEQKTTCFSSNYSLDELRDHLSVNGEKVKASRIIERVRYLAEEFQLSGKNYRL